MRRTPLAIPLVVLALTGAACGSSTGPPAAAPGSGGGFPVTIRAAGGAVRVPKRPTAIISLSPTATEMLYAIGAGAQVKAVDDDSDYPPQAPRTKLSGLTPNIEAIASYHPDLVIACCNADNLESHLAALHIPMLLLPAATQLSDVYREIDELGTATGHAKAAEQESGRIRSGLAQIVASVPSHHGKRSYYYELQPAPYYSATSSTFVGRLLSMIGLTSIANAAKGAAAAGGYPELSAEFILKSNPDYILLADTICCHQDLATVAKRPGWNVLAAVKRHHVIALNDDIASRWGPRIVDLLRTVAQAVYGRS